MHYWLKSLKFIVIGWDPGKGKFYSYYYDHECVKLDEVWRVLCLLKQYNPLTKHLFVILLTNSYVKFIYIIYDYYIKFYLVLLFRLRRSWLLAGTGWILQRRWFMSSDTRTSGEFRTHENIVVRKHHFKNNLVPFFMVAF